MEDHAQISRIVAKLPRARSSDSALKVFGASGHKYLVHAPASIEIVEQFEARHGVSLPESYRRFVLSVGNGGPGYAGSGAGPFYGIYELGKGIGDIPCDHPEVALRKPCVLSPGMSQSAWNSLTASLGFEEELDDDAYEQAASSLWGGLLPIGSQGCTYLHCLVLNGAYAGRVVNVDLDHHQAPHFAYEQHFLDWYERWLDEVIAGDLLEQSSWFGYVRGGPEEQLLAGFKGSNDPEIQQEYLDGLLAKRRLTSSTLRELAHSHPATQEQRSTICKIVCKSDDELAKPLLEDLAEQDPLSFFQCMHWYAGDKIRRWQELILSMSEKIKDKKTFEFFTYVLEKLPVDGAPYLLPFTRHAESSIRTQAFYALGRSPSKSRYLSCFFSGLDDADNNVVRTTLQALAGLKDRALVPHYRKLAQRFPEEKDYVLTNLDHRLAELKVSRGDLMRTEDASGAPQSQGTGLIARARQFFRKK